jgi:hypothetical protein
MNLGGTKGGAQVEAELNRQLALIEGKTLKGLILGSVIIHNDTEKTSPLTPVDLGNLRASRFTVTADSVPRGKGQAQFKGKNANKILSDHNDAIMEGQGIIRAMDKKGKIRGLMMGYTANYAFWVHENIGANFKRPGAGPKWFESSVKRNTAKVLQAVRDTAKIK